MASEYGLFQRANGMHPPKDPYITSLPRWVRGLVTLLYTCMLKYCDVKAMGLGNNNYGAKQLKNSLKIFSKQMYTFITTNTMGNSRKYPYPPPPTTEEIGNTMEVGTKGLEMSARDTHPPKDS